MIIIILIIAALISIASPIAFLIGLYKVLFDKEDKAFGVKLLTYATIGLIIGFGTCSVISFG